MGQIFDGRLLRRVACDQEKQEADGDGNTKPREHDLYSHTAFAYGVRKQFGVPGNSTLALKGAPTDSLAHNVPVHRLFSLGARGRGRQVKRGYAGRGRVLGFPRWNQECRQDCSACHGYDRQAPLDTIRVEEFRMSLG